MARMIVFSRWLLFLFLVPASLGMAQPTGKISTADSPVTAFCSGGQSLLAQSDAMDSAPPVVDQKPLDEEFYDESLDFLEEEEEGEPVRAVSVADPLAPFNRFMFQVNDRLYFWALKPVTRGYRFVVPGTVRLGVKNLFSNLTTPIRFTNCLLQGKWRAAEGEFLRFIVNSTRGVLGFGNPARTSPRLNPPPEDLGQTLGVYGIGNGIYIVWPLFGPSTLRDSVGMIGDRFLNPITYLDPAEAAIALGTTRRINDLSFQLGDYEAFKTAALEPYVALREGYVENRRKKVAE